MTDATQPVIAMTTPKPYPVPGRAGEKPRPSNASGFSLLELSIVIVIIALVAGVSIDMGLYTIEVVKEVANNHKLNVIEQALMSYRLANERLPCPTDATLATTSAYYGYEAGSLSGGRWVPDMGSCMTSGTYTTTVNGGYTSGTLTSTAASSVAANYNVLIPKGAGATNIASNTYVAEGAVPFKALGLPEEFMYDAWGRKFAYAVWAPDTAEGAFLSYGITPSCGAITVNDASGNHRSQSSVYALVSFGPNGHGGYTKAGTRYFSGSDNGNGGAAPQPPPYAGEWTDCHCNATGDASNYIATYVQKQWSEDPNDSKDSFDDTVRFKERWQMIDRRDLFQTTGLPCTPGFRIDGTAVNEALSVASGPDLGASPNGSVDNPVTADLNGDGKQDLILNSGHVATTGRVYVVFGRSDSTFPDPLPLSSLNGTNGFTVQLTGFLVVQAGDVDGDKIDDLVIGNVPTNCAAWGYTAVVFGHKDWASTRPATITTTNLDGTIGSELNGPLCNNVWLADLNGDGRKDIIVGTDYNDGAGLGSIDLNVFFGRAIPWPGTSSSPTNVTTLDGTNGGFRFSDSGAAGWLGGVAAGNLNGDSSDDLLIGIGGKLAYVLPGKASGATWTSPIDINTDTTDGTIILPAADSNGFASEVRIGNVNGGSMQDAIIYDGGGSALHVIFGTNSTWPTAQAVNLWEDGAKGFNYTSYWATTSGLGLTFWTHDVTGDGKDEILSSNLLSSSPSTNWPLIFGRSSYPASTQIKNPDGTTFSFLSGAGSNVAAFADVNGDGIDDIIMSSASANSGAGITYVIFGHANGSWPTTIDLSNCDGTTCAEIDGATAGDLSGSSLGTLDINGDGIKDVITCAPGASYSGFSGSGSCYVIWGHKGAWKPKLNLGDL